MLITRYLSSLLKTDPKHICGLLRLGSGKYPMAFEYHSLDNILSTDKRTYFYPSGCALAPVISPIRGTRT